MADLACQRIVLAVQVSLPKPQKKACWILPKRQGGAVMALGTLPSDVTTAIVALSELTLFPPAFLWVPLRAFQHLRVPAHTRSQLPASADVHADLLVCDCITIQHNTMQHNMIQLQLQT